MGAPSRPVAGIHHHTIMTTTKQTKLTPADIEAAIVSEHIFTAADGDHKAMENAAFAGGALDGEQARPIPAALHLLTFCVLILRNGAKVVGINYGAIDPTGHDPAKGRALARLDAVGKVWELEGYALRERLAAPPSIQLTRAEVQSGHDRVRWAEGLIKQLPADHDGRNSWLLNYGRKEPGA